MKKTLALALCLALVVSTFTGCGTKKETETPATEVPATEAPVAEEPVAEEPVAEEPVAEGALAKTGLAVVTSLEKSKDASAEEGLAQVDSMVVAVIVDQAGKILDCKIDAAQTKIGFSAEGKVTTDLATTFKSKQELGADYGMAKASSIAKEWNEQATALADYVVGKTIEEVKGIALTDTTAPADADLASSVTISIGGYIGTIEKAVANAKELGAVEGDTLGLSVETTIDKSADAGEEDGKAQAYTNYVAITTNAEGKITSSAIDASQGEVTFSAKGIITTDLTAAPKTKQELGADYGMAKASTIGKEWFEQVNSFSQYVVGKTVEEVKGIAVTEEGAPTDADLASSVTLKVGAYLVGVEKAFANAAK